MISSQLGRAARATTTIHTGTAHRTAAASISATSTTFACSRGSHQRRLSSSKASCPPDDGANGARPAATAQQSPTETRSPATRSGGGRQTRGRKGKEVDKATSNYKTKGKETDGAFGNLPSVPSTNHMHPNDITLSSFFSLHRPLSLTKPVPPPIEKSAFERIFETTKTQTKGPQDVFYTLSNTIETLENASQNSPPNDLQWQVVQENAGNGEGVRHLDGLPRTRSLEEIVATLKPFRAPPAPTPMDETKQSKKTTTTKKAATVQQQTQGETSPDRSFKTTLFVHETTGADGAKYYTAQASPVVQIANAVGEIEEPQHGLNEIKDQRQPFLERMRQRQWRYLEYREDRAARHEDEMLAISVKRQRKLKMKKHKYKKLMKRTRNLRRRLDRN